MMRDELIQLAETWLELKKQRLAVFKRQIEIERRIKMLAKVPYLTEGVHTATVGFYVIKNTAEFKRQIDPDWLFRTAIERGVVKHLPRLFKMKAKINKGMWQFGGSSVTEPLKAAIVLNFRPFTVDVVKTEG